MCVFWTNTIQWFMSSTTYFWTVFQKCWLTGDTWPSRCSHVCCWCLPAAVWWPQLVGRTLSERCEVHVLPASGNETTVLSIKRAVQTNTMLFMKHSYTNTHTEQWWRYLLCPLPHSAAERSSMRTEKKTVMNHSWTQISNNVDNIKNYKLCLCFNLANP